MLRIHQVLKSSRAAIDLASIMVGIIVIGLIGGVIAATVFAVIPWAQDNAAKQQLDGVASAESAYRGLSTSKDANLQNAMSAPTNTTDPNQVVLNSTFTGSAGLAVNNLLALNASGAYCAVATTDGKDYHAYSKSGSGKWFYITSGKTQPTTYTGGNVPCVTSSNSTATTPAGTVDAVVDNGTGAVSTTPAAGGDGSGTTPGGGTTTTPTPVPINWSTTQSYDFETNSKQGWSNTKTTGTASVNSSVKHGGTYAFLLRDTTNAPAAAIYPTSGDNKNWNMISGTNYRITLWVYSTSAGKVFGSFGNDSTNITVTANTWNELTFQGSATSSNTSLTIQSNAANSNLYIDDAKFEVIN